MSDITGLKIKKETKSILDKLVEKHGGLQRDFIHKMVVYFQNTGTDPDTFIMPSAAEELKKFRDTIIGFMRKQEADYIKPTFGKMNSMMEMMVRVLEDEKQKNELNSKVEIKKEKPLSTTKQDPQNIENTMEEVRQLKNKLEAKKHELITMKTYFLEVCNSVENKSTGMQKKNIVTLDEAKFEDHFKWLKSFEIE